ncbi:MAG: DUF1963 domain-containing protein [Planctomycetales bacterium]|nr:DUF1963 domain-containing protein [Planctomycetales bacterium]
MFEPIDAHLLPDERPFLDKVVDEPLNDEARGVYADWLDERGDQRGEFLRQLTAAGHTLQVADFPDPAEIASAWLELVGHPLLLDLADCEDKSIREAALPLARPALRMTSVERSDDVLEIGASKLGGLPDLPSPRHWPVGEACRAIYNDATAGYQDLAGFLGQVNLAEIAGSYAARDLPSEGLLSFFCFQDWEQDNPDAVGVCVRWFPSADLRRIEPHLSLTLGNEVMQARQLQFAETLDLPEPYDGPWSDLLHPADDDKYFDALNLVRERNFTNMLGYGRATSGADPTPDRDSRHLIVLDNSYECRMHIQIPASELARANFDAVTLNWVDFD